MLTPLCLTSPAQPMNAVSLLGVPVLVLADTRMSTTICFHSGTIESFWLGSVLQTELLPRCGEIAPVGQVVHENGKVLLQAVLEVRDSGTMGSSPEQGQLWALFLSSIAAEPRAESPAAWVGAGRRSAGSVCSVAGHWWPGLPQSHGSLRRNPLCLEQALLQLPEPLDQGGHAAGWLPLSPCQS